MNTVMNEMVKVQYNRYLNGHIETFKDYQKYLVCKGFSPVNYKEFKAWMKNHGSEIIE